jgi:hypothetical protein
MVLGLGFGLYWIELRRVVSILVSGLLLTGDVVMIMVMSSGARMMSSGSGGVSIVNVVEGARMRVRFRVGKVKRVI